MQQAKPHILISPIDWGLGHASRCVRIINALLKQGAEVTIAGNGLSLQLLKSEFPDLNAEEIPGFTPVYSAKGSQTLNLLFQSKKFLDSIRNEKQWLDKNAYRFNGIISDNRYGIYSNILPSVLITHQLNLPSHFLKLPAQELLNRYLSKPNEIWIPDFTPPKAIASKLTLNNRFQGKCKYIGWLSRMQGTVRQGEYILFLLSGPEPQRSLLEEEVFSVLEVINKKAVVVRGTTMQRANTIDQVEIHDMLPAAELQPLFENAEMVIARSGYSTIMDLLCAGKKGILIPTPGQAEQELLAKEEMIRQRFTVIRNLEELSEAIALEEKRPSPEATDEGPELNRAVSEFLDRTMKKSI